MEIFESNLPDDLNIQVNQKEGVVSDDKPDKVEIQETKNNVIPPVVENVDDTKLENEEIKKDDEESDETKDDTKLEKEEDKVSEVTSVLDDFLKSNDATLTDDEQALFTDVRDLDITPESINTILNATAKVATNRAVNDYKYKMNPEVRKYEEFINNGGKSENYWSTTNDINWKDVVLKSDDTIGMEDILISGYRELYNMEADLAQRNAKMDMESGDALAKANNMKTKLVKADDNSRKNVASKQHDVYMQELETTKQYNTTLKNTISKEALDINGQRFVIPKDKRDEVYNYLTTPYRDKKGGYYTKAGMPTTNHGKTTSDLMTFSEAAMRFKSADMKVLMTYFALEPDALNKLTSDIVKDKEAKKFKNYKRKNKNKSTQTKPSNVTFGTLDVSGLRDGV